MTRRADHSKPILSLLSTGGPYTLAQIVNRLAPARGPSLHFDLLILESKGIVRRSGRGGKGDPYRWGLA